VFVPQGQPAALIVKGRVYLGLEVEACACGAIRAGSDADGDPITMAACKVLPWRPKRDWCEQRNLCHDERHGEYRI
jgi:hypothetical protein